MPWVDRVGKRYFTPKTLLGFFLVIALMLHAYYVWKVLDNQRKGLVTQDRVLTEILNNREIAKQLIAKCVNPVQFKNHHVMTQDVFTLLTVPTVE